MAQPLPELHAPLVEFLVLIEIVVGADDRGVAPDVSLTDPAALDERDIANAVFLGLLAEIAAWSRYSADERRRVMASLPQRLGRLRGTSAAAADVTSR